jgi:hypothetical protein
MKMERPTDAVAISEKINDFKQSFWLRAGVFALSVAGGILFVRILHAVFSLLPSLGVHADASPVADVLNTLHTGFGN